VSAKRVYLLGARFSMAISGHGNVPPELRMPSMQDLSDAVLARLQRNPRQIANSEAFLDSLRKLFSVADGVGQQETFHEAYDAIEQVFMQLQIPGAGTPLVKNFEQWLSYLIETPPWLSPADQTRNRAAFLEVSRAVHDVLEERQRTTLMYQKDKCPDWLIRLVRRWHEDHASVITFNYDQLVELAWLLYANPTPPRTRSWDLYPALLTPLTARVGNAPPVYTAAGGFQLLKLHGSVGWWYSGPDGPPGDIVYDQGVKGGEWHVGGVLAPDELMLSMTDDREPMIVPPAAVKSPYYNNLILREIWRSAASNLAQAEELVIMGFSLPATDMLVSSMLCTNVSNKCVITPVDYGSAIIERTCETFAISPDNSRLNKNYAGLGADAIPQWVEDYYDKPAAG
jgi:hypothetical protein